MGIVGEFLSTIFENPKTWALSFMGSAIVFEMIIGSSFAVGIGGSILIASFLAYKGVFE